MWKKISYIILRNRIAVISLLVILTAFFGYQAKYVKVSYGLPKLLPDNDSTYIQFENFKKQFGEESLVFVLGLEKNPLDDISLFNAWYDLGNQINNIRGVDTVISICRVTKIVKNNKLKRFDLQPVVTGKVQSAEELSKIKEEVYNLPFYRNLIYNDSTGANIMILHLTDSIFHSTNRAYLMTNINKHIDKFEKNTGLRVKKSGLPYIRDVITSLVKKELKEFILLSLLITIIILFLFFKSGKPVLISVIVVSLGVIWSLGVMGVMRHEISILTGIIPPLIIIIGVPNCIFLINKFHQEYKTHGNQAKALSRAVSKVGNATFMTNLTTAIGFATFVFTKSSMLQEFGLIASINIMSISVLSILIIPIAFSIFPPPKEKHIKHLDKKWINGVLDIWLNLVTNHRKKVYVFVVLITVIAFWGIFRLESTGNIVDDLPKKHPVSQDLDFFEKNFKGIMPFEVVVDTKKKNGVYSVSTLRRIEKLQNHLYSYRQFSKPVSIVEGIKFAKQAYYNGNPKKYQLITNQEKVFLKKYLDNTKGNDKWLSVFVDSLKQKTRIAFQIADIGTKEMEALISKIRPEIDSILSPEKYRVDLTGTSIVFLKGADYLTKNLFISLALAILTIGIIMSLVFSSFRMILVSMATNLIPLILTAAAMGFAGIHIKPSTILVFSIAFGISVDDTIHYLAKYRQELKANGFQIGKAAITALKETGVSMMYTSIILFFGFSVFMSSQFGGTKALGVLISFTLLVAMIANLVLLPSLLLSLEKALTTKSFEDESFWELEEEDSEENNL
jgi:hypothetical protein